MPVADQDRTAPPNGMAVPDRAVVLVHGIGSQQRGTVLSGWVQAILDWVEGTDGLRAQIDRVHADGDGPAWADLVLGHPAGVDTVTTRVRLYEAFWADVIRPPSFGTLVRLDPAEGRQPPPAQPRDGLARAEPGRPVR